VTQGIEHRFLILLRELHSSALLHVFYTCSWGEL